MCVWVLTHLGRRFLGPEGRCIWGCTPTFSACLWERMKSKCGCADVSEGKVLHMDKHGGWAVHNTWPWDNKEDPYPYIS